MLEFNASVQLEIYGAPIQFPNKNIAYGMPYRGFPYYALRLKKYDLPPNLSDTKDAEED